MKRSILTVFAFALMAACASTGAPAAREQPVSDPSLWEGDPRLYAMLEQYPLGPVQRDSLAAYQRQYETSFLNRLGEAAMDDAAPAAVRVNALMTLAQRKADTHMQVFRVALDAEDVRVRASAVAAMRDFVLTHPREALGIARMALSDPEPDVQAQALQILGDTEIDLLREYIPRAANQDLAVIARDLVQLAEQRGAPLLEDDAGVLTRTTASGWRVMFTPKRRWPQWNAALGDVTLEKDGARHEITDIEAVAGVVPVFMSPDARHVVFERNRTIIVRTLADGSERLIGDGIAPRPRPFTDQFVFLREIPGSAEEQREKTKVRYEVLVQPFDAATRVQSRSIGSTAATVSHGVNGSYSPVRWMRLEERVGNFYLTAPGMEIVSLPDPFGSS